MRSGMSWNSRIIYEKVIWMKKKKVFMVTCCERVGDLNNNSCQMCRLAITIGVEMLMFASPILLAQPRSHDWWPEWSIMPRVECLWTTFMATAIVVNQWGYCAGICVYTCLSLLSDIWSSTPHKGVCLRLMIQYIDIFSQVLRSTKDALCELDSLTEIVKTHSKRFYN